MSQLNTIDQYEEDAAEGRAYDQELEILLRLAMQREKARRAGVIDLGKVAHATHRPRPVAPRSGGNVVAFPGAARPAVSDLPCDLPPFRGASEPVAEIRLGNVRFGLLKGPDNIFADTFN